jgi:hypothetical protein
MDAEPNRRPVNRVAVVQRRGRGRDRDRSHSALPRMTAKGCWCERRKRASVQLQQSRTVMPVSRFGSADQRACLGEMMR